MNRHYSSCCGYSWRVLLSVVLFALAANIYSPRAQQPPAPDQTVPPYVFNGAYAAYRISSGSASQLYAVSIRDIDRSQRAFQVTVQVGRLPSPASSATAEEPFDRHVLFLALTPNDLAELQQNVVPDSIQMTGARVVHDVSVSVPAGKFVTQEITIGDTTLWFDSTSGLLVKCAGAQFLQARLGMLGLATIPASASPVIELVSTNIPMGSPPETSVLVWIMGAVVVILVLALVAFGVYALRGRRRKAQPAISTRATGTNITTASLDRIAKLKSLLDQGLITREEFDKEKARILGS
jgi:hypothetical protein